MTSAKRRLDFENFDSATSGLGLDQQGPAKRIRVSDVPSTVMTIQETKTSEIAKITENEKNIEQLEIKATEAKKHLEVTTAFLEIATTHLEERREAARVTQFKLDKIKQRQVELDQLVAHHNAQFEIKNAQAHAAQVELETYINDRRQEAIDVGLPRSQVNCKECRTIDYPYDDDMATCFVCETTQ